MKRCASLTTYGTKRRWEIDQWDGDLVVQDVERTQLLNVSPASVVIVKTISKAGVDFA